jgi:hypothetical protein
MNTTSNNNKVLVISSESFKIELPYSSLNISLTENSSVKEPKITLDNEPSVESSKEAASETPGAPEETAPETGAQDAVEEAPAQEEAPVMSEKQKKIAAMKEAKRLERMAIQQAKKQERMKQIELQRQQRIATQQENQRKKKEMREQQMEAKREQMKLKRQQQRNKKQLNKKDSMESESKRTIAFKDQAILVSEGSNGVGIYDSNSGNALQQLDIQILPEAEYDDADVVTNAVSIAGDFILMANGGAGFGIAKLDENNTLVEEGVVDLEGSSNYIQSDGDYIFVASGTGGLRIIKISQPEVNENFAECESYDVYTGRSNLNVNSNEVLAYRGSATLKNLNVGGDFTFCGSINIQNSTNINSQGTFNMRGAMAVGIFGRNHDLNINSGSVLRIEGTLVVYGNLNLNSGSTLEFIGNGSRIHVFGNVRQNSGSTVIGNYSDTSNKLK